MILTKDEMNEFSKAVSAAVAANDSSSTTMSDASANNDVNTNLSSTMNDTTANVNNDTTANNTTVANDATATDKKIPIKLGDGVGKVPPGKEIKAEVKNKKTEEEEKGSLKDLFTNALDSFSSFGKATGKALADVATYLPNKLEEVYDDPKRRKQFIRGLYTIAESSGYDPAMKSPIGKIATGQLKAEQFLSAEEIALEKAKKTPKYITSELEKAVGKAYTEYGKDQKDIVNYLANLNRRYDLFKSWSQKEGIPPTGLVENFLTPFQEIGAYFLKDKNFMGDLINKYKGKEFGNITDKVAFKQEFDAASKQMIIGLAKNLYPVSENDVRRLLESIGSVSSQPEALASLLAMQKTIADVKNIQDQLVVPYVQANREDIGFISKTGQAADALYKKKLENTISEEGRIILKNNFGIDDPTKATGFQLGYVKYLEDLKPTVKAGALDWIDSYKSQQQQKSEDLGKVGKEIRDKAYEQRKNKK